MLSKSVKRVKAMWADLPLFTKGFVALVIPLSILGTATPAFYFVERQEHTAQSLLERSDRVGDAINQVTALLVDAETSVNGYALSGNGAWLVRYVADRQALPYAIQRLSQLEAASPEEAATMDAIKTLAAERMENLESLRTLAAQEDHVLASPSDRLMDQSKVTMDQLRTLLGHLETHENQQATAQAGALEVVRERILAGILLAGLLGVGGGVVSTLILVQSVIRRVKRLETNAHRLERGDPLLPVPAANDEIGHLGRTLQRASTLLAQREQALRQTSAFLEHVIHTGPSLILRRRPSDLGVTFVSANAERLLGYTVAELTDDPLAYQSYIHPDDAERFRQVYRCGIEQQAGQVDLEYRFLHKDGTYRWIYGVARLEYDEAGKPIDVLGYAQDITERKRALEDAELARGEAERANRAKSEFLSRMSHELRTPLNAISGFSQLLEMDPLPPDAADSVKHIRMAGDHLLQLINEVLDIARIEAGRMDVTLEAVDVGHLTEEALALIQPLAAERAIQIHLDQTDQPLLVWADRNRLKQVLLNLLTNAVKYNRPHGEVRLSRSTMPDGRVRIAIQDTGPGIPLELMHRLFTPFDRLGAEQTSVEGTGIGLSLSKRLVDAMHGTMGVSSAPGLGSTFWVEFARAQAEGPQAGGTP